MCCAAEPFNAEEDSKGRAMVLLRKTIQKQPYFIGLGLCSRYDKTRAEAGNQIRPIHRNHGRSTEIRQIGANSLPKSLAVAARAHLCDACIFKGPLLISKIEAPDGINKGNSRPACACAQEKGVVQMHRRKCNATSALQRPRAWACSGTPLLME